MNNREENIKKIDEIGTKIANNKQI